MIVPFLDHAPIDNPPQGLEVRGAALATVIARVLEFCLMVFMVLIRKNPLKGPAREYFSFDRAFAVRIYKNSAFTTLNETLWSGANSAMSAAYGHAGTVQYAAYSASVSGWPAGERAGPQSRPM